MAWLTFRTALFISNEDCTLQDLYDAAANVATSETLGTAVLFPQVAEDLAAAGVDPTNSWAIISEMQNIQSDACHDLLVPKWGPLLAGVDIVVRWQCVAMLSFVITQ